MGWYSIFKTANAISQVSALLLGLAPACAGIASAEPTLPRKAASKPAPPVAAGQPQPGLPSRMRCTPVTPQTLVPWIDVAKLPDLSRDTAYFEACDDLDTAWTTQSYPDPKYVPSRTLEHEARVARFLQGVKAFVAADTVDWAGYVNGWLGTRFSKASTQNQSFADGTRSATTKFNGTDVNLDSFDTYSKIVSFHQWRDTLPRGLIEERRLLSLVSISSDADCISLPWMSHEFQTRCTSGTPNERLCITPTDIQLAFDNQPGYLMRPMSVRTARTRPSTQELAQMGGQWFGYDIFVFDAPVTNHNTGTVQFGFGFMPCAARVEFSLKKEWHGAAK